MKKLLLLTLVILAAWTAWKQVPRILERPPEHELVVENQSHEAIERLRIMVGSQTFVKELLGSGEDASFTVRVHRDQRFEMTWQWASSNVETVWQGGHITQGPIAQRHVLSVLEGGGVIHHVERRFLE